MTRKILQNSDEAKKEIRFLGLTLFKKSVHYGQMTDCRKSSWKPKRLDLIRRAKLLGVTPGHLYRVINGERQSQPLAERLAKLIEAEDKKTSTPTKSH